MTYFYFKGDIQTKVLKHLKKITATFPLYSKGNVAKIFVVHHNLRGERHGWSQIKRYNKARFVHTSCVYLKHNSIRYK